MAGTARQPGWLPHRAAALPQHPAVVTATETLTYAGLHARALALARMFQEGGAAPGDRVALLLENSIEFAVTVHAASLLGAVLVPLNLRLAPGELAYQLADARPALLVCHEPTGALASAAAREGGDVRLMPLPARRDLPPLADPRDDYDPGDLHSIIYTSGTTGRPKGAMLTYGNFWASAAGSAYNLGVLPGDRWLACMPLFHVGGLSILLRSAIYGITAVVHSRFDEHAVNRALRHQGVTLLSVVSAMLQRMLDADDEPFPPAVRAVLVGGGPVPPALLARALDRGLPVVQTYGLTEAASQIATLSPAEAPARIGSAGRPLITTRLQVDAPPGEPGEILVEGPTVSPGYWGADVASAAARDGTWFRTGDIGRLDADGYLYVLDRREDLVVTGGENVYPAEVEAALVAHPGVSAAAVVGLPDAAWGQVVAAAVVPAAGVALSAAEVEGWVRSRLAGFKVPRRIIFVEELPMTASGKVQRRAARALFGLTGQ